MTTNFFSPLLLLLFLDPGSGMDKIRIQDIHPRSATLVYSWGCGRSPAVLLLAEQLPVQIVVNVCADGLHNNNNKGGSNFSRFVSASGLVRLFSFSPAAKAVDHEAAFNFCGVRQAVLRIQRIHMFLGLLFWFN